MAFFFYTRAENKTAAKQAFARMKAAVKRDPKATDWDAMSGQRGLRCVLHLVTRYVAENGDGAQRTIVVDHLSDLARDVPGLVRQIAELLKAGTSVLSVATGLSFEAEEPNDKEPHVIFALAEAHVRYTSENRKRGQNSAKEAGAQIGRPTVFTLDRVREALKRLTDAKKGQLPSVRDLAKAVGCGNTKAGELIAEYRSELESEEAAQNQEAEAGEQS